MAVAVGLRLQRHPPTGKCRQDGYLWWTGYFELDGQPLRAFAARGYGQQLLMVIPELELVIAIYSHDWNEESDKVNQLYDLISRFVIPAVS